MAISQRSCVALFALLVVSGSASQLEGAEVEPSLHGVVQDELPKYGLPRGLLPDTVEGYSLSSNGEFVLELRAPCYIQFTNLVYYDKTIRGKLSYGIISDLSGIQVKKFFIWVPITTIVAHVQEESIEFQSGFLSETFPAYLFQSVPACKGQVSASCRGTAGLLTESFPISEA